MLSSTQLSDQVSKLSDEKLRQYFARIGVSASEMNEFLVSPSLEVLCEIHRRQVSNIHISNYDMQDVSRAHLEHPVSPYFEDIFRKIVVNGGHGYCFDNNKLLRHVLQSLGYKVSLYNAHVIRDNIPKADPQHAVLVVEINQKEYLVDAGYGGVAPVPVTELKRDEVQTGAGKIWRTTSKSENKYKIVASRFKFDGENEEDGLVVCHEYCAPDTSEKSWKPLYIFHKKPCDFKEFLEANDRVCKIDETTPFKNRIFETAFEGESVRKSLTQDELFITNGGTTVLRKPVVNAQKYNKYLGKHFGHPESREIRDRVTFGHATNECLLWHRNYKEQKRLALLAKEEAAEIVHKI